MEHSSNNAIRAIIKPAIGILTVLGLTGSGMLGAKTWATDFTITIDNSSATSNHSVIFDHQNIAPGFMADEPIIIINNSDSAAEVKILSITENLADPNLMAPYVSLSLIRNGAVVASGTLADPATLIGAALCVPTSQTDNLMARFALPSNIGNAAQGSSLSVVYTLQIQSVDECPAEPIEHGGTPSVPDTGLPWIERGMVAVSWLGGIVAISVGLFFALGKRQRKKN